MASYKEKFIKTILDKSVAKEWTSAVNEWDVTEWEEDVSGNSKCICGKENIIHLFTITNRINKEHLFPVGSRCIKKFDRPDLNEKVSEKEALFNLLAHVENNDFLTLKGSGFTRKLINYFYENDVFKPNKYNDNEPFNDYAFLLSMFNKRTEPTEKQQGKITAIILNEIKPYLIKMILKKTNRFKNAK